VETLKFNDWSSQEILDGFDYHKPYIWQQITNFYVDFENRRTWMNGEIQISKAVFSKVQNYYLQQVAYRNLLLKLLIHSSLPITLC